MKRLVVLGAGESGLGTAVLGKQKGYDVFVSDKGTIAEKYKEVLVRLGVDWEEEQHTEDKIFNADVVMKSPGIPDKVALIKQLKEKGIPVISEIEFAGQFTEAKIVGITGSNGKTTTTSLAFHLLSSAGLHVGVGGNIGDSFAQQVAAQSYEYQVLELSSFQLDGIEKFRPHIAVLTNITPDHLDRYDYKFENYIASKFRIAMNQTEHDFLIYDADDPVIGEWLGSNKVKSTLVPFSLEKELKYGAWLQNDTITIQVKKNDMIKLDKSDLQIKGNHNVKNAMAAATVASLLEIRNQTIRESLVDFEGVEHRLEKVLKINNVQYVNDSKATNVNAVYYALDSMTTATVWIVGGVDKGNNYSELLPLVHEKVKAIICLGLDNTKLFQSFGNVIETMVETASMDEAVKLAYALAEQGDNVLLSPACASFDLFDNYEDRGRQFKEAVRNL